MKDCFPSRKFATLLFWSFSLSAILLVGCGGGGSSSATTGVSPVEIEIQAALTRVATAIKSENLSDAMSGFDSNLKYYPANAAIIGGWEDYNQFRTRLSKFFAGASITDFSLTSLAISPGLESTAMARGILTCSYSDSKGDNKTISEQIEISLEKFTKWGITEMYAYDNSTGQSGMYFPPIP